MHFSKPLACIAVVLLSSLLHAMAAPNVSGSVIPSECASPNPPQWCSGNTADAWIRAACSQLPPGGGIVDLTGFGATTQTLAESISGCTSRTKQVTFLFDTATTFNITESDGGIVFPLDNASAAVGLGAGQCIDPAGLHLASSANVMAIFGPAHVDGTQQSMTVKGICAWGHFGASVTKGLIYTNNLAANTTIEENNLGWCNTSCAWVEDPQGEVQISNNWFNVTRGDYRIIGTPLEIFASGGGAYGSAVQVFGNTFDHSNGPGQHEVNVTTAGDGSILVGISLHDNYSERADYPTAIPSSSGVHIQDCWNCSVRDYMLWGGAAPTPGTNGFEIGQSAPGRTQDVTVQNVWVGAGTDTNVVNDTINSVAFPYAQNPYGVNFYVVNPPKQVMVVSGGS